MNPEFLIDSDVLIEYLRGNGQASEYLEALESRPSVSVISAAELFAGARNQQETNSIDQFLLSFDILPVGAEIAKPGGQYRRTFGPANGTGLADGLIAATAKVYRLQLLTFNLKHYPMIHDARVPYARNKEPA